MTHFTIQLTDGRGALLIDGHESDLFGELVGCDISRDVPLEEPGRGMLKPVLRDPVVNVTLRLPLGRDDRLTLIRDTSITTLNGPTQSEVRSTAPGAVALLDRWLAAHPNAPGGALIAKAREMLTGQENVPVHCVSCGAFLRSVHPLAVPESVTCAVCVGAKARGAADASG